MLTYIDMSTCLSTFTRLKGTDHFFESLSVGSVRRRVYANKKRRRCYRHINASKKRKSGNDQCQAHYQQKKFQKSNLSL